MSDPARLESLLIQGAEGLREGRFAQASSFYSEWIRENPECADAYLGRGRCAAGLGDHLQALEDFTAALDLDPESAESLCARALSNAALGNSDAALSDLDDSLRLRPDLAEAYCARAVERLRRGQPEAAIEDSSEAIRLRADFAEAYHQRHLANSRLGRTEMAAEDYEQARCLGVVGQSTSALESGPAPKPPPVESPEPARDESIPEFRTDSVFISYASEDREQALQVKRAFDEAGVDAWLDKSALESGEVYRRRIETNIENCSYFVPLISRNSTTMEKRFFRREWSKAIQEAEEFPPEYPFIQPVLLDDTSLNAPSIPRQFRDRHVRRIEELPQLIEEAKRRIRERRLKRMVK